MKLLLIFGLLALIFGSFFLQNNHQDRFQNYRTQWGKTYTSDEAVYRRAIFEENVARIEAHNATPGITYTEGINQFTDLTAEEFEATYLGLLPTDGVKSDSHRSYVNAESIDWEKKGAVSAVKNQGSCGSCWAFSAVANLEVLNFLEGSKKMELFSEQQLVDCSKSYGNHGCQGGLMTYAYKYVKDKGIVKQDEYPYVARDQTCKKDGGPFKIDGYTEIKNCDDQIEKLQKQTVAVAADASRWSSYSSGIFSNCGTRLNHGITLVGWNKEEGYWRIKNSWGPSWGEKGFMRLKYPGSTCGICDMSCIPYGPKWV